MNTGKFTVLILCSTLWLLLPAAACANGTPQPTDVNPAVVDSAADDTGTRGVPPENSLSDNASADDWLAEPDDFFDPFDTDADRQSAGTAQETISDPFRGYNRSINHFNDKLYFYILKPVATGYAFVVPAPPRRCIKKFFLNLAMPVRFLNCLLQIKPKGAGIELSRFVINTSFGLAGFFDPAGAYLKLRPFDEDMGQTFGRYGMGPGFYFVLPLFGPSSSRDTIGLIFDLAFNPTTYVPGAGAVATVNKTSLSIGDYESLKAAALDPYISLRNAYFQHREKDVNN